MSQQEIELIKRIKAHVPKMYGTACLGDSSICGTSLLRAIQFVTFTYIYENISASSDSEFTQLCHYFYFKTMYQKFNRKFDKRVGEIKTKVRKDILARAGGNEKHPAVKTFDWVVKHKEMHVRHPKQTPANQITKRAYGTGVSKCHNSITDEVCVFDGKNVYQSLIFTPLASDENDDAPDNRERTEPWYNFETRRTETRDDAQFQFNVTVTKKWGKLFRLLHNLFHLHGYINALVVNAVDKRREEFAQMPWDEVWEELVGAKMAQADISEYKKTKGVPMMVAAVYELYNIVRLTYYI